MHKLGTPCLINATRLFMTSLWGTPLLVPDLHLLQFHPFAMHTLGSWPWLHLWSSLGLGVWGWLSNAGTSAHPLACCLGAYALVVASLNTTLTSVGRLFRLAGPVLALSYKENGNQTLAPFPFPCPASHHAKHCPSQTVVQLWLELPSISQCFPSPLWLSLLWQLVAGG